MNFYVFSVLHVYGFIYLVLLMCFGFICVVWYYVGIYVFLYFPPYYLYVLELVMFSRIIYVW